MSLLKQSLISELTGLSPSLRSIIEEVYVEFARYKVGIPLGVCKCNVCCSDEHETLLARTPLREISSQLLSEYTNSAHGYSEAADGHVLRYFLPRYFELIALNDPPDNGDLWQCLARLGTADYRRKWPACEADVIDRYFDALLIEKLGDVALVEWPVGKRLLFPINDLVEMMILGGGDIDRILAAWQRGPEPGASVHLAALASELTYSGGGMVLSSVFLSGKHDAACLLIGQFVCRPETLARLEKSFFDLADCPDLQKIVSDGHAHIESLAPCRQ